MDPAVAIAVGVAMLATGVALLVIGLRGRLLSDHPSCRRCGYDLWGLREPQMCPECGSDLARRRAMRRGVRQRRPIVIATGAMIVAMSLAGCSIVGYQQSRGFDWNTIKPVWLLVHEASREGGSNADGALDELLARQSHGDLSDEQVAVIAERGLEIQGDLSKTWNSRWGDLILRAHGAGLVAHEDYVRFARQAIGAELRVRPEIVEGEPVVAAITARFRSGTASWLVLRASDFRWSVDGERIPSDMPDGHWMVRRTPAFNPPLGGIRISAPYSGPFAESPPDAGRRFPAVGEAEVLASFDAIVTDGLASQIVFEETIELGQRINVLPEDSESIELVRDDRLHDRIKEAISFRVAASLVHLSKGPSASLPPSALDQRAILASYRPRETPMDFAFDVYLRLAGAEFLLGQVTSEVYVTWQDDLPIGGRSSLTLVPLDSLDAGPAEIILRPSTSAARRTFGITRIWDGEITYRNVPILRQDLPASD